jgi:hypothetical protein
LCGTAAILPPARGGRGCIASAARSIRPRWRGRPVGQDVAVETLGRRVRLGVELAPQRGPEPHVLLERLLALPRPGVEAHQGGVGRLAGRLGGQRPLQRPRGLLVGTARLSERRQFEQEADVVLPQGLPPRPGPILVAVVRQQLPGVQLGGCVKSRRVPRPERGGRGRREGLRVDPQRAGRLQGEGALAQMQYPGRRGLTGAPRGRRGGGERPARGEQGHVQVVDGRRRVERRPERLQHPVAAEAVPRRQRQQLHQAPRLPQPPRSRLDLPPADRRAERAQQPQAQLRRGRRPGGGTQRRRPVGGGGRPLGPGAVGMAAVRP